MPPNLTIITAVRNCLDETKLFLQSLRQFPMELIKEIIIIDDGSDTETQNFLERCKIRLFTNDNSIGLVQQIILEPSILNPIGCFL